MKKKSSQRMTLSTNLIESSTTDIVLPTDDREETVHHRSSARHERPAPKGNRSSEKHDRSSEKRHEKFVEKHSEKPLEQRAEQQDKKHSAKRPDSATVASEQEQALPSLRSTLERYAGILGLGDVYHNLSVSQLYEHSIIMREGILSPAGALLVQEPASATVRENIIVADDQWLDKVRNRPADIAIEALMERYVLLHSRVAGYMQERDVYVIDGAIGIDYNARIPVQVITDAAWIANMVTQLIREAGSTSRDERRDEPREAATPSWTIIIAAGVQIVSERDKGGEKSSEKSGDKSLPALAVRAMQCRTRQSIIAGAIGIGDVKFMFASIAEYVFAQRSASLMRGLVLTGKKNDSSMIFGYGGSVRALPFATKDQSLVGHDAYIWNNAGISAIDRSVIETFTPDTDDVPLGFGTLVQYPVILPLDKQTEKPLDAGRTLPIVFGNRSMVAHAANATRVNHPRTMVFLVPDVFGSLPFVSRLTQEQALFLYLIGYGMKSQRDPAARTGRPNGTHNQPPQNQAPVPQIVVPAFMPCYHPTSILRASQSVRILQERLLRNNMQYWVINTGWVYGNAQNGKRVRDEHITIALQNILNGAIDTRSLQSEPIFGLQAVTEMEGIPEDLLMAHATWKDMRGYESSAKRLQSAMYKAIEPFKGDIDGKILSAIRGVVFEQRQDTRDTPRQDTRDTPRQDTRDTPRQDTRDKQHHSKAHPQSRKHEAPLQQMQEEQRVEEQQADVSGSSVQNEHTIGIVSDNVVVVQTIPPVQASLPTQNDISDDIALPMKPIPTKNKRIPAKKMIKSVPPPEDFSPILTDADMPMQALTKRIPAKSAKTKKIVPKS
jgi:phosphoenolpyruvate carboxykinase (ATP)